MSSSISRLCRLFSNNTPIKKKPIKTTMPSSISRLCRVFANNTPIKKTTPPQILTKPLPKEEKTTKPSTPPNPSLKDLINIISEEKNLTTLVENFKKFSKRRRFRSQHLLYEKTINRLALAKQHSLVEQVLEHQKKFDNITKEGFAMRLISLYGKAGMFDHALKLFYELPELKCARTVKSFNTLLYASIVSKKFDETEKLFREVSLKLSIEPDIHSYTFVIQAFVELGSFDSAVLMLDEMEKNGVKPGMITFNTLLSGYNNGKFEDAEKIWARMEETGLVPDIYCYNAKLLAFVNAGKISEAVEIVEQLRNSREKPNRYTYNILIKWYCRNGNLDEAKSVYDHMLKSDLVPDWYTFDALIPCVCEKGDFDLALKLCEESISSKSSNCHISADIVQVVVNGLVKESKVGKAKGLVETALSKTYFHSNLKMPQEEE
ncbi:hypothetical protein IFM89_022666 [Coptis chinensis]|uniref:Pentatricopeptide repeat-containing protein n=1 Tax=Coptis chinensis TaxID=261450 RepID=A0A835LCE1_9MAGN|nr:hypothetical protein IFM89_022666 [Coptis chinensis]